MKITLKDKIKVGEYETERITGIYQLNSEHEFHTMYDAIIGKILVKIKIENCLIMNWCDEVKTE